MRLKQRSEFLRFFKGSEILKRREFQIYRIQNDLEHPRLGITIKCRCTSVERMRVKRIIREWFRHQKDELGTFDYNVVIPTSLKICYPYPKQLKEGLNGVRTSEFMSDIRSRTKP